MREDLKVADWQSSSIEQIQEEIGFIYVLVESGKRTRKETRKLCNCLYYMWNIKSVRRRKVLLNSELAKRAKIRRLDYTINGRGWAELDKRSVDRILIDKPEYIYHCAGILMEISTEMNDINILSNHHGDPRKYRGRPAGFYEMLDGSKVVGQIIQVLSNDLDAGKVLAFGESAVMPWSYRQTLNYAYKLSPFLLKKAVKNLRKGKYLSMIPCVGARRLPTNVQVLLLALKCTKSLAFRIYYGTFIEKRWRIAFVRANYACWSAQQLLEQIREVNAKVIEVVADKRYSMFADCFLMGTQIVAEGLSRISGLGELVIIDKDNGSAKKLDIKEYRLRRHLSYPYTLVCRDEVFIYPECGEYPSQLLLRRRANQKEFEAIKIMRGIGSGLIDPSVVKSDDKYYILGNLASEQNILRLWYASNIEFTDYKEHPDSPIVVGIHGGRNGGRILREGAKLYRLSQDLENGYGVGIHLFEIIKIDEETYEEKQVGAISMNGDLQGPHTVDYNGEAICWDYYRNEFSLLAGYRRLASRLLGVISPHLIQ